MGMRDTIRRSLRLLALAWICFAGGFAARPAHAQTVGLYELARFSLGSTATSTNPEFIGSNPIGVGWNGSKLYVAGFNGSGATTTTSIVEITNASGVTAGTLSGVVTPTYSTPFAALSSPSSRGYIGLSMKGNQLAAAFDGGSNTPTAIQVFDTASNTKSWDLANSGSATANIGTSRGMSGPAFDPGFEGNAAQGSGVAWVTQGQGRRFLNNASTGAGIYTTTADNPAGAQQGMAINTSPTASTTWRDFAFDPATGDLYTRNQLGVTRTNRTGANSNVNPLTSSAGQSAVIWTQPTAANNIAMNVAYSSDVEASTFNSYAGDLLVFNDRSSTATGQAWTDVIKFSTTSGTLLTPNYTFISNPLTGTAAYDFEWDPGTQTLAVLDFANRNVHIFSTAVPEPTTWALLGTVGITAGVAMLRRGWKPRLSA